MTTDQQIAISVAIAFGVVGLLAIMGIIVIVAMSWSERNENATGASRKPRVAGPSAGSLLRRAAARKCPVCGRGEMFKSYFKMNTRCSECGSIFWKNEGEWMGPAVIDYMAAGIGAMTVWIAVAFLGWPQAVQLILTVLAAVIAGVGVLPWSRSIWTVVLFLNGEMMARE